MKKLIIIWLTALTLGVGLASANRLEPKFIPKSVSHIQQCYPQLFEFKKPEDFRSLQILQAETERYFTYKTKTEVQRDVHFTVDKESRRLRLRFNGVGKKPLIELAQIDKEGAANPIPYKEKTTKRLLSWNEISAEVLGVNAPDRTESEFEVKTTQGPQIRYSARGDQILAFDIDDATPQGRSSKSLKCDGDESSFVCRCSLKKL